MDAVDAAVRTRRGRGRLPVLIVVCLVTAAIAAAFVYRRIRIARSFRTPPEETLERPRVEGPGTGGDPVERPGGRFSPSRPTLTAPPGSPEIIIWEAEWANHISGTFEPLPARDAGGRMAVWAPEGTGRNNSSIFRPHVHIARRMGLLRYTFRVRKAGRYRVCVRLWAMDCCGNSFWVAVDGAGFHYFPGGLTGPLGAENYPWPEEMYRRWLWIDDDEITYDLVEGVHTLGIAVREDGIGIDQIALVPIEAKVPSGVLPANHMPVAEGSGGEAPFGTSLGFENRCITAEGKAVPGMLLLRSNAEQPRDCEATLSCPGAEILPADRLRVSLTPEAPVEFQPIELHFPDLQLGQWRRLGVSVRDGGSESRPVLCSTKFYRPLAWWTLRMGRGYSTYRVFNGLRGATEIDTDLAPGGGQARWQPTSVPESFEPFGALDLVKIYGRTDGGIALAATRIRVKKTDTYTFTVAGDDDLCLMCDGRTLLSRKGTGPITDHPGQYQFKLEEGVHLLVASLTQSGGKWQLLLRFSDEDGNPTDQIEGLADLK